MFHKAVKIEYKDGTTLELTFRDGMVKRFDVSTMFDIYPPLCALRDRELFVSGRLSGGYGIRWNDELDLEVETVYEEGNTVRRVPAAPHAELGDALLAARAAAGLSQTELAAKTGINQADISRLEHGYANPTVSMLQRLADGLGTGLSISFPG